MFWTIDRNVFLLLKGAKSADNHRTLPRIKFFAHNLRISETANNKSADKEGRLYLHNFGLGSKSISPERVVAFSLT